MKASEILQIVSDAKTNHGFISIRGYLSESGQVANLIVQPLGPNGYHSLVLESMEQVRQGKVEKPTSVTQEVWNQAIADQIASWEKTLGEGHGRENNFSEVDKGFYTHETEPETVYIRNVRIIKKDILEKGEFKEVNSKPLTIAKRLLVAQTPVSKYQGTFKLNPTKFVKLSWDRKVIETAE